MSQKGAFDGENTVYFSTLEIEDASGRPQNAERVPEQFLEGKSNLKVDVVSGGAPYNFDLQSDDSPGKSGLANMP